MAEKEELRKVKDKLFDAYEAAPPEKKKQAHRAYVRALNKWLRAGK